MKKNLSDRDICTKYITPAIEKAGWDKYTQLFEEISFTDGKIYVRGKLTARGPRKRADYILYYKPNIPIAIVEAKNNKHSIGVGMQQALLDKYADEGIVNIESMHVLKVKPLTEYGSPLEIIKECGSNAKYQEAVKDLENELYNTGA